MAGNVGRQTVIIRQNVSRSVAHTHTLLLLLGLHTTLCSSESAAKSAKSSKKEKKFEKKKKPPSERPALADLYKPRARQSMTSRSSKRGDGTPAAIVKVGCRHENSTHASSFFVLLPTTTLPKFPWKFSRRWISKKTPLTLSLYFLDHVSIDDARTYIHTHTHTRIFITIGTLGRIRWGEGYIKKKKKRLSRNGALGFSNYY